MSLHSMHVGQRGDGKWMWVVKVGDDVVASDASQGYENESDCMHSLFGLFFGTWDESFLTTYERWQSFAGEDLHPIQRDLPEGAEPGPNVLVQTQEQRDLLEQAAQPENKPMVDEDGGVHPS